MKKYLWGVIFFVILTGAVVFTLLDAFVIERVYEIPPQLAVYTTIQTPDEIENEVQNKTEIENMIEIETSVEIPTETFAAASTETTAMPLTEIITEPATVLITQAPTAAPTVPPPTVPPAQAPTVPPPTAAPTQAPTVPPPTAPPNNFPLDAVITDWSYKDSNLSIEIEKLEQLGVEYYIAEVKMSSISYFKTALAKGLYGRNITEKTPKMAEDNNAVFAVNGDFYGFRDGGILFRNGIFYRNEPHTDDHHSNEALLIDMEGNFSIAIEGVTTNEELAVMNILHGFSFGPALVIDGKNAAVNIDPRRDPRVAIGQAGPLHYIFIVSGGRNDGTNVGMSLPALADIFIERGCDTAYNLDGGGSTTMWFNGRTIYTQTDRAISDIIYIPKPIR